MAAKSTPFSAFWPGEHASLTDGVFFGLSGQGLFLSIFWSGIPDARIVTQRGSKTAALPGMLYLLMN